MSMFSPNVCYSLSCVCSGDMGLDNSPNTIAQMKSALDSTDFYLHIGTKHTHTRTIARGGESTKAEHSRRGCACGTRSSRSAARTGPFAAARCRGCRTQHQSDALLSVCLVCAGDLSYADDYYLRSNNTYEGSWDAWSVQMARGHECTGRDALAHSLLLPSSLLCAGKMRWSQSPARPPTCPCRATTK